MRHLFESNYDRGARSLETQSEDLNCGERRRVIEVSDLEIAMNLFHQTVRYALRALSREVEQAGAICFRTGESGPLEILLVASRRNGRWGLPKGHIDPGETAIVAAEREAFEEAGVSGTISPEAFGSYVYTKKGSSSRYNVSVFLLKVHKISSQFLEHGKRKTRWVSVEDAIIEVDQPGLTPLLRQFRDRVRSSDH